LSSSVQNYEGGGDGDGGDSFADPFQGFKQGSSSMFNHFLGYV
jgi:hypothetical protein